ncbi:MAG TPA: diacylglycerol kinase [Nakamurella multipartita]|nr:diacylglycerol kinase [Nakamurella multipartita]
MLGHVTVLVNPLAGRGRARRVAGRAIAELRRCGVDVQVVVTRSAEHATQAAAEAVAAARDAVVVCGGDGAIAAVLPVLAGGTVPLGVLAGGSGNDFARALGLPVRDPIAAARVVARGVAGRVDLGRIGERWFGTVVAAGFDARVNERMNAMTWPRGRLRYHAALIAELAAFRPLPFTIEVDGQRLDGDAMLVAVANTGSYGGGMRICPDARFDDALLDVTVVTSISRAKLVRLFPSVYSGRHVRRPEVLTLRGRCVRLSAPGVIAYADGERVGPLPATVTAVPGALAVLGAGRACG